MRDLRFTGLTPEGDLILADTDGDPYRVPADADLVKALGVGPVADLRAPTVLRPVPDLVADDAVDPEALESTDVPRASAESATTPSPGATVTALTSARPVTPADSVPVVQVPVEQQAHPVSQPPREENPPWPTPVTEVIEVIDVVRVPPAVPVSTATVRPPVPPLRPRDIQARIRAGSSIDDVARESGMDPERVERYAGPPLAERAYMAERARATEVRRHDGGQTLEDAVVARLVLRGSDASDLIWDAWRRDDGRWTITLEFADGEAAWLFDPEGRALVAADEQAHTLTGSGPAPDLERPRLTRVEEPTPARLPQRPESRQPESRQPESRRPEPEPPTARQPETRQPETVRPDAPISRDPRPEPPAVATPPDPRSYDELASAMRAGTERGPRPTASPQPEAPRSSRPQPAPDRLEDRQSDRADDRSDDLPVDDLPVDDLPGEDLPGEDLPVRDVLADDGPGEDLPTDDVVSAPQTPQAPKAPPAPTTPQRPTAKGRKSKRASVPSWDDIVFGARPDDSS